MHTNDSIGGRSPSAHASECGSAASASARSAPDSLCVPEAVRDMEVGVPDRGNEDADMGWTALCENAPRWFDKALGGSGASFVGRS